MRAANAEGFTFYIGGDIALNPWPVALVNEVRAVYPGMAIHVPDLDAGDGPEAVALARSYGLPAGYKVALDIEPGIFRSKASPAVAASYADQWCEAVSAAGYVPVVYGTVATCAACANHAAFIWLTVPGVPNPDSVGLAPSFFAGRRAIQYASVALNGVSCDVSNSQYPLGGAFSAASGSLGGFMALSDQQQADLYQWVSDIHGAIGTGPGETLGLDLQAIEAVLGIKPGTTSAAFDPSANPNYLGWTRDVTGKLDALKAAIAALPVTAGGLTSDQAAALGAVAAGVAKLEAFFNKGGA